MVCRWYFSFFKCNERKKRPSLPLQSILGLSSDPRLGASSKVRLSTNKKSRERKFKKKNIRFISNFKQWPFLLYELFPDQSSLWLRAPTFIEAPPPVHWCDIKSRFTVSSFSFIRFKVTKVCLCNLIKTASWNTLGEWGLEWSASHLPTGAAMRITAVSEGWRHQKIRPVSNFMSL